MCVGFISWTEDGISEPFSLPFGTHIPLSSSAVFPIFSIKRYKPVLRQVNIQNCTEYSTHNALGKVMLAYPLDPPTHILTEYYPLLYIWYYMVSVRFRDTSRFCKVDLEIWLPADTKVVPAFLPIDGLGEFRLPKGKHIRETAFSLSGYMIIYRFLQSRTG